MQQAVPRARAPIRRSLVSRGSGSTPALIAALAGLALASCGQPEREPTAPRAGSHVDGAGAPDPVPASEAGEQELARLVPDAIEARLPRPEGALGPAQTELDGSVLGEALADVDGCGGCHADARAQWETSAHAFASFNNPLYRVSIERLRDEVNLRASRFCAGCHDPALLVDGAMDAAIAAADPRAHAGITCRVCHGVSEARVDGNGSYTLVADIPVPSRDGADADTGKPRFEPQSVARHRRAVRPARFGPALCASCHRSFLGPDTGNPTHLSGQNEPSAWRGSAHNHAGLARIDDPVPRRDCAGCHMPREPAPLGDVAARDGQVASHRFLGGHTWLAAMRGDTDGLARARAFLRDVVTLDLAPAPASPAARSPSGDADIDTPADIVFDAVIRNTGVGHRFPGGVMDAQDTWIEVVVTDARGAVIAASGLAHARDPDDDEAHVLRAMIADDTGAPVYDRRTHRFRAVIANHTVPPRDVAVVRYAFAAPRSAGGPPGAEARDASPLRITARLLHRSRNLALSGAACVDQRTAAGRAFARGTAAARGRALDACAPQPITELAAAELAIAVAANGVVRPADAETGGWAVWPDVRRVDGSVRPRWLRAYEHAMGLQHIVQERLDEARPGLAFALAELTRDEGPGDGEAAASAEPGKPPPVSAGGSRARAAVLVAMGRLEGAQGRTAEALARLAEAEQLAPGHPAITAARAAALTAVWRWREAAPWLAAAAGAARENLGAWRALAIGLGSLGRDAEALAATHAGLMLDPRDAALLRVQALSLRALAGPRASGEPSEPGDAAQALAAYDHHRPPDAAAALRFACARGLAACEREREPVHVHRLAPTAR